MKNAVSFRIRLCQTFSEICSAAARQLPNRFLNKSEKVCHLQGCCRTTAASCRRGWLARGAAARMQQPAEVKYWDPRRVGSDGSRRVPDVVCTHPHTGVEYVIDVRMFWGILGEGPSGYSAYQTAGWGAAVGEKDKRARWKEAIRSRQDRVAHEVKFVPFCVAL